MSAANQIRRGPNLHAVILPLIELMARDGTTWSDREKIARAIAATTRHADSMEAEESHLLGALSGTGSAAGQAMQGLKP